MNQRTAGGVGGVALVLFGVAIGVAADRLVLSHHPQTATTEDQHRMALQHLRGLFDLDDGQVTEMDEIFSRHQDVVIESWTTVEPRLRMAIESVHASMESVLRPDQIEAFHAWLGEQGRHEIHVIQHQGERSPPRH